MKEFREDVEITSKAAKEYAEAEIALFKVRATKKITKIFASVVVRYLLIFLALIPLIFAFLTLAFYLSAVFESTTYGFLAVFGITLIFIGVLFIFRQTLLVNFFQDGMIKELAEVLFEEDED